MRRLVAFCLGRPITTLTIHICLLLTGAIAVTRLPLNSLPRSERPRVRVSVPYPNAEPRQVELEVTRPLEEALATLRGIKEIWSESRFGQGQVNLQFEWGTDLDQVKLEVRERLARVRNELPVDDIERIRIRSGGWRSGDAIIQGRISSKGVDLSQNYELLLNRLRRPLERIEGVAQVEMDGVTPLEIQVTFRQDDLDRHGLRLDQIIRRLEDNNIDITVGELLEEGKLRRLRVVNTFHGLEDVRAFPVNAQGVPLEQVAKVELTEGELRWGRHLNGRYAVSLEVFKESDANTVETCARIRGAIDRMEEDPLLEGIHLLVWVDQGKLIIDSLKGLRNAGLLGGLLAVGILLLFLRRFSATILVGMAIPISVLSALAWLYLFDRELNVITLVALMLGVGMLVDTAVVVVESIVRISGSGARAHEAARRGTFEVATPIFAATLTSVIVFVPIFFGTPSQLTDYLTELGMVISLTLGSSLFVSLTLIPMVSARIYGGGDPGMGRWFAGVRAWYGRFLEVVLGHRALTLGVTAALIASVVIPFRLGFEVNLSDTTEITRNVSVFYQPQGQSLDYRAMEKIVDEVEAVLSPEKERLGIADIYSWYRDNFAWTSLYPGEEGVPEEELARIGDEVGKLLPEVPGVEIRTGDWGMYHGRRRGRSAGGTRVRVYGDSSALVDSTVERLRERFVGVEGVTDTEERQRESVGEIRVEPEEEKLSRFELSSRELSRRVAASFSGNMLREIRTESGDVGLRVQLAEEEKASVDELHDLRVALPGGGEVPLAEITSFEEGEGPKERHRENRRSSASFAVNFDASARPAMRSTVESVLGAYSWPRGYSYDLGEEWRHRMRNRSQFLEGILLAIFLVYLVMACLFESLRHPLALMVTVLLAIPGVAWGLFLWGDSLDQPASVGLILLAGIVVNNGIVFIDHVNRHRGQGLPVVAAIRRGGEERLRPILITALTTIIGLMPMAWGQANAAGIYYFTLSRAIICGLAASTFLTLIVLPVIYSLLAGRVRAAAAGGS